MDKTIEQVRPAFRAILERAYLVDPDVTHRQLVELGMPLIASQLKIDLQMGRLPTPY